MVAAGRTKVDRTAVEAGFAAIVDPVERAAAITAYGRTRGNLWPTLRRMRDEALRIARGPRERPERLIDWIADKVDLSPSRVSRILDRAADLQEVAA